MGLKLYISGPIKGLPEAAALARFRAAEWEIRAAGHEPVNPFDCAAECGYSQECPGEGTDAHYDHYLRGDLIEMLACDGVALLDGWEASRGARIEQTIAVQVGLPVAPIRTWLVDVGALCHWQQSRGGVADRESHAAFHYDSPCPYEVVAALLRGEPDPREAAA